MPNQPNGYTTALVVLKGAVQVNGSEAIQAAEVGLFDRAGETICIDNAKAKAPSGSGREARRYTHTPNQEVSDGGPS